MSQNKNDKNTSLNFEKLAAHVGLAACTLASIAVIAEAFEARVHKATLPMVAAYGHATKHAGAGHAEAHHTTDMRKEEIRHMHVSYGATMRSHPIAGSL